MLYRRLIIFCVCVLNLCRVTGQCPERGPLYKRLVFLRDSAVDISSAQKLNELLQYEKQMASCSYPIDSVRALLLQRIGAAYYAVNDIINAISFTKKSIEIISSGRSPAYDAFRLKNYSNLVIFYKAPDDYRLLAKAIDSCIAIGNRLPTVEENYLIALTKKVEQLFDDGDYQFCYNYSSIGLNACARYRKDNERSYFMFFFIWKINTLITDKKYNTAGEELLNVLKDTANPEIKNYLGTIYEQLAQVAIYKKDPVNVLKYVQRAVSYDESIGYYVGCMETLNNLGYAFYFNYLNDFNKSLLTYKLALKYGDRDKGDASQKWESLNILANIARLYTSRNHYDSAFFYFQAAFDKIRPGINEARMPDSLLTYFLQNGDARYLTELVIDKADAFLASYQHNKNENDFTSAIRIYKWADRLINKVKTNHIELGSKLAWRKNSKRLYEHAIEACYQHKNITDAFYFLEKSRAVILEDQLAEQNLVGLGDILLAEKLKKYIAGKEISLKNIVPSGPSYENLFDSITGSKQKLFELQQAIKIRNPLYYQHFIDTSFISIGDVRDKVLKDHKALIEIYAGDSAVYVMLIEPGKINFTRINKTTFDSLANRFIHLISNASLLNQSFPEFVKTSRNLYTLIFKENTIPPGRIIISPDGRYFPFEALITNNKNIDIDYLLRSHAISYAYSSRYLLNEFNTTAKNDSREFLGMAPVNYPRQWNLASLEDCDVSLDRLKGYFSNADIQVFGAATKNKFMNDFTKYKIIQLYTHAADTGSLAEPEIYFADSALYLSELVDGEKPETRLIVLAACNTGVGTLSQGEGVFSLSRGFASLGIPASVSNLWAADKVSVIRLTELFYKYLDKGMPTDVALQQAKLEFLKTASNKNQLPYYWAGTILTGKSDLIEIKKTRPWKIISIIVFIIVFTLFANRMIRRSKINQHLP